MTDRTRKNVTGLMALVCLAVCLAAPVLHFLGRVPERTFKTAFLVASVGWFVFGVARGKPAAKGPAAPAP